jgi:excisionase family DNA binding protein
MKLTFDKEVDVAYIKLNDNKIARDVNINDYCIANLDADNNLVGIEFLFASKRIEDFELWFDLLSTANYLNVPKSIVKNWINEKQLPAYKFETEFQLKKTDLDKFIESHKIKKEKLD